MTFIFMLFIQILVAVLMYSAALNTFSKSTAGLIGILILAVAITGDIIYL